MTLVVIFLITLLLVAAIGVVTVTVNKNVSGAVQLNQSITSTDNLGILGNPSVAAAQAGVLTTHTNNTSGTITMSSAAHTITTGERVDLYWSGGHAYGAVVGTVSGVSVPIASVSGGSALPAAQTPIIVGPTQSVLFSVTGNNLTALFASAPAGVDAYFVFNTGSADSFAAYVAAGNVYSWQSTDVAANPLAGVVITTLYISHDNISAAVPNLQAFAVTH